MQHTTINLSDGLSLHLHRRGRFVCAALVRDRGSPAMPLSLTSERVSIAPPEDDGLALLCVGDAIFSIPAEKCADVSAFLAPLIAAGATGRAA